jgi:PIN domain nuclease of toxin-antitoxin system
LILLDTHVLVWYVQGNDKLGLDARRLIERETTASQVLVPIIAIWEVALATHRGKIDLNMDITRWTRRVLNAGGFKLAAIEPEIAIGAAMLKWAHKDPADRFIVSTAVYWDIPLLTVDRAILAYAKQGGCQAIDARR